MTLRYICDVCGKHTSACDDAHGEVRAPEGWYRLDHEYEMDATHACSIECLERSVALSRSESAEKAKKLWG